MQQGMSQSMVATAAMQMFMRALQASSMELSQMVAAAVAANPALEELPESRRERLDDSREDIQRGDAPPEDAFSGFDGDDAGSGVDYDATRRHNFMMDSLTEELTLAEHLGAQVRQSALPAAVESVCLQLISYLDEHGYFTEAPEDIAHELNVRPEIFRKALRALQDLDPAGVGATGLRQSLMLQLERLGEGSSLPMTLLRDYWDELIRHRYDLAAKALGLDEVTVAGAAHRLARLNPDPGSAFSQAERHVISPDLLVTRNGRDLNVYLTGNGIPRLGLSPQYREMLAEHADQAELRRYLSRCFREGRDMIRAIADRQETILTVARAIVERQKDFFLKGPQALAPLKMEQIADTTGLAISTVSRAVKGKYLRCDHGVYELRRFFTAALPATEHDEGVSAGAIQARIRALVDAENPLKPLSDAKIETALAKEGITVARRTIAKYRDQLKILPASLRKQR